MIIIISQNVKKKNALKNDFKDCGTLSPAEISGVPFHAILMIVLYFEYHFVPLCEVHVYMRR